MAGLKMSKSLVESRIEWLIRVVDDITKYMRDYIYDISLCTIIFDNIELIIE